MNSGNPESKRPVDSRAGIRRTVLILSTCAIASYVLFLASMMGGK